ncbi:hypothetical protein [Bradyrhizobium sp. USDA 4451]
MANLFDISTFDFDYKLLRPESKSGWGLLNEWAGSATNVGKTGGETARMIASAAKPARLRAGSRLA